MFLLILILMLPRKTVGKVQLGQTNRSQLTPQGRAALAAQRLVSSSHQTSSLIDEALLLILIANTAPPSTPYQQTESSADARGAFALLIIFDPKQFSCLRIVFYSSSKIYLRKKLYFYYSEKEQFYFYYSEKEQFYFYYSEKEQFIFSNLKQNCSIQKH